MAEQQTTMAVNCLSCGAELEYDPTKGLLHCEFCDSEFTAEEIDNYYKQKEEKAAEDSSDSGLQSSEENGEWGADAADMRAYSCSACGAELIAEENTAAMICPYCGNSTIVPAQFSGAVRPQYVIPFAFTKAQAESSYKNYYKSKKLLPKSFESSNHIEDIQGVYVPFWLFDGVSEIDSQYKAYDRKETQNEIIKTHYDVHRHGTVEFERVPADASVRMPDDLMDSIEPYKFDGLKEFSMAYMPGFLAERFNVSEQEDVKRAKDRIENTTKSLARQTVKHDSVSAVSENVKVDFKNTTYAMLPVWYLVTKWNNETYKFAMNGQTGEFIGDLPIDSGKMALRVIITAIIVGVIAYLLCADPMITIIAAIIAGAISGATGYASMKPVSKKTQAIEYIKQNIKLSSSTDNFVRTEHIRKENRQQQS